MAKHNLSKRFVSSEEAVATSKQHVTPCADCPFARTAIRGWLGSLSPEDWIQAVHGEALIECHVTTNQQCAGAAIYRANILKKCRSPEHIVLEPDKEKVFATPIEFLEHHS